MSAEAVLDASAVLALMQGETGAEAVAKVLPGAMLGMVNLAEIVSKLCERGMPAEIAHEAVLSLGVRVAEFSGAQARLAGALRPVTKAGGLSLGDRACLALAMAHNAVAITADKGWGQATREVAVEIRYIRGTPPDTGSPPGFFETPCREF